MQVTRRQLLIGGAAAAALPFAPSYAASRISFGSFEVETLSDGHLVQPAALVIGTAPKTGAEAILAAHGLSTKTLEPPCNLTLLRDGPRLVLFDVGAGPDFMPTAGKLHETLAALGVAPEAVTHVVMTHGHPDHLWGLLDAFDEPVFSKAQHFMARAEFDFWRDPATLGQMPPGREIFAAGAKRRLDTAAELFAMVEPGQEVLPGVEAVATHGHTPGHMSYALHAGSESLVVVGDAITNAHIAFEEPRWPSGTDQDAAMGAETRAALLDRLAGDKMAFVGFHLPEGGLGRVERAGGAYRFAAEI